MSINAENISLKEAMLLEESELMAIRQANADKYRAYLKELDKKRDFLLAELSGIEAQIDIKFHDREVLVAEKEAAVKNKIADAHHLFETAKQALKDSKDELKSVEDKGKELDVLKADLAWQIQKATERIAKIDAFQTVLDNLIEENKKSAENNRKGSEMLKGMLQDATDKEAAANLNFELADRLLKENQREQGALAVLKKQAEAEILKAQEIIKKMGPRWSKREA